MALSTRSIPFGIVCCLFLGNAISAFSQVGIPLPLKKTVPPAKPAVKPQAPPPAAPRQAQQLPRTLPPQQKVNPAPAPAKSVPPQPVWPSPVNPPHTVEPVNAPKSPVPPSAALRPLPPAEAAGTLHSLNAQKASQSGINRLPLPANAQLKQAPNGHYVMNTASGKNYGLSPDGKIRAYQNGQTTATLNPNGKLQTVHSPNLWVTHGPGGQRRVESRDAQGGYTYSTGPGRGFVEQPVQAGGDTLIQRTSVNGQNTAQTYYQSFESQNGVLENYVPDTQYSPGFYQWLSQPWSKPVSNAPGSAGAAAQYGNYFQPNSTYNSPNMWMTDQVIANQMPEPGTNQNAGIVDDPAPASEFEDLPRVSAPQMTPISSQEKAGVSQQLSQVLMNDARAAQAGGPLSPQPGSSANSGRAVSPMAASAGVPMAAAFDPTIQYYFVDDALDVKTERGEGHCSLSKGDTLHRSAPVAPDAKAADLLVVSGMKGDCPSGDHVSVTIRDLQAMNNHCHESLSLAVNKSATEEGKDGFPAGPPSGATEMAGLPAPDLAGKGEQARAQIASQQTQSAQLEASTQEEMLAGLH